MPKPSSAAARKAKAVPLPTVERVIPQCIRWRDEDFALICEAARQSQERVGPWIRGVVLARVDLWLKDKRLPALAKVPAGGRVLCIRFRPPALERVKRFAAREGFSPFQWIRAIAVAHARARPSLPSLRARAVASRTRSPSVRAASAR